MTPAKRSTTVKSPVKPPAAPKRAAATAAPPVEKAESPNGAAAAQPSEAPRSRGSLAWLRQAGIGVWVGLFITLIGFGLIAFAWGKTAGLVDVAFQIPYLVSAGLTGLGLILVGLLVVSLSARHREAADRERQIEELIETMIRIRKSIEGSE
jgi:hypothetical protein